MPCVEVARLVPPSSLNRAAIDSDLTLLAPTMLDRLHNEVTHPLEQLIRSYDSWIGCATHFLDLQVEESS